MVVEFAAVQSKLIFAQNVTFRVWTLDSQVADIRQLLYNHKKAPNRYGLVVLFACLNYCLPSTTVCARLLFALN